MIGAGAIALAGNPNSGKSTLFNVLTGSRQHVGNWPGKTVEQLRGSMTWDGSELEVVDLPGTYSLAALSPEEIVVREFLLGGDCDAVVIVVDAANLERNLYLAVQVLELGVPAVVALNMADRADAAGIDIDSEALARSLAVPVVRIVARRREGIDELVAAVSGVVGERAR